ncbi:LacI family DNA-binding transcriptional regulator [Pseudooceanicola batsensis]|uniref:LacI family DNA-binding transcriptional regulator n=1 Tax=Pseudooceanicola batsensis TaxID=314255 RepID=UPI001EE66A12|nr:LacI family DNA-binding transcriptional regulator [Pseudooceanicola batsensis]
MTSFDVARAAGVSQPAVSRAFNPKASITKEKRDRVLAAARELGYVPNVFASSLSKRSSKMVAVISGNLNNPFYSESLQVFVENFQRTSRQVLAFSVQDQQSSDEVMMEALRYPVDGIVMTSAKVTSEMVKLSEGLGIPVVMFNRSVPGTGLATVQCDNRAGGAALARRMAAAGARSFLVLRGDPQGSTSQERVAGFRDTLAALGRLDLEEIEGGSNYSGGYAAIMSRFNRPAPDWPDAIFAVNDIMAIGCADALRGNFGLRIPEDILLAGFDGIREGQRHPYRLTTVRQPIERMVSETLDILDQPDGGESSLRLIPGDLIPGTTVKARGEFL